MAPPTKCRKKALAAAPPPAIPVIDPADRLSKLPEEILVQILSFLPAQEAVRACVLGRTWRDVWKFTRRLRITGKSVREVRKFVRCLLRVRHDGLELAPLDVGEVWFDPSEEVEDEEEDCLSWKDTLRLNKWIRCLLKCRIQMLRVNISARGNLDAYLEMKNTPLLVSRHLTRLKLTGVWFTCHCLDLDGCPALEHLEINECCLYGVMKMTSQSLKHLVIISSESIDDRKRIQISFPRLVSLLLDDNDIRSPLLERMPDLVRAKVHIGGSYMDRCNCQDPMTCYHITRAGDTSDNSGSDIDSDNDDDKEGSSDYAGQNTTKCMVLEGLAQAKNLELIAIEKTYIFRRDFRCCPTFSNLKTLVLINDYWCEPADCSALACMLEHAPLLEKLTLISDKLPKAKGKFKVEMKGYPDAKVKSTKISQHLQVVEIKCEDVNERFLDVLNFLGTLNICFSSERQKVPDEDGKN